MSAKKTRKKECVPPQAVRNFSSGCCDLGARMVFDPHPNAPPIPPSAYNASYLKPDPRFTTPVAKPGGFKSVAGPFSASDAAATGFIDPRHRRTTRII